MSSRRSLLGCRRQRYGYPTCDSRSIRCWKVDFHVRTESRSSLVQVLSTGNRAAAHSVSAHVLAAWRDLNHLAAGPEALAFVSLFDDTADVWANEDVRLVEPLSIVSRWSRPDEFADVLNGAARYLARDRLIVSAIHLHSRCA